MHLPSKFAIISDDKPRYSVLRPDKPLIKLVNPTCGLIKATGCYDGTEERSYIVTGCPDELIKRVGNLLGQESVILVDDFNQDGTCYARLVYVNGPNEGKHHLGTTWKKLSPGDGDGTYFADVDGIFTEGFTINFNWDKLYT